MKKLMIVAAIFALTACATRGQKFEMSDVESFQPGVTTYQEVVEKLGKPRSQNFTQDGGKSVTWVYARASLAGSESRGTRLLFDKDGKLVRVMSKVE